jgi:protein involved in polysaccharide export with SLBB domain
LARLWVIGVGAFLLAAAGIAPAQTGGRVLTTSDVVTIRVLNQPDLDTTTRVEPDGTIQFPYVGRMKAAGLSEGQLERAIERRLVELKIIVDK